MLPTAHLPATQPSTTKFLCRGLLSYRPQPAVLLSIAMLLALPPTTGSTQSTGPSQPQQPRASTAKKDKQRRRAQNRPSRIRGSTNPNDARNRSTGKPEPPRDPEYARYGIYAKTAPRAPRTAPIPTRLPLQLARGDRIALVGNTLLERAQHFGYFEALLHVYFPQHELTVRNLAWSADTPDLQPRPDNFADTIQHLTQQQADVILVAYGFNESFAGQDGLANFRQSLRKYIAELKTRAFNGKSAPRIVLLSPIANENV